MCNVFQELRFSNGDFMSNDVLQVLGTKLRIHAFFYYQKIDHFIIFE